MYNTPMKSPDQLKPSTFLKFSQFDCPNNQINVMQIFHATLHITIELQLHEHYVSSLWALSGPSSEKYSIRPMYRTTDRTKSN